MFEEAGIGYNPEFAKAVRAKREFAERMKHADMLIREAAQARGEIEAKKAARDAGEDPFKALREMVPSTEFERIARRGAVVFKVRLMHIKGGSRKRRVALARQFIMYWACRRTSMSSSLIGRLLGGRDHATVNHGVGAYRAKRAEMGRNLPQAR